MKKTKSPCWDGYRQDGYKMKDGKRVPNCVKIKDDYAKVGKKGGIVPSKKAPKSGTKNPNPKEKDRPKEQQKEKPVQNQQQKTEQRFKKRLMNLTKDTKKNLDME